MSLLIIIKGLMANIGIAIITHCAEKHLKQCLPPLLASPARPRVLVVNSSSGDGTVALAKAMGAETLVIPREEFNHGLTRERARRHLATEVAVMMTPDAYAVDPSMIERLVSPILQGETSVSYGRQIAHEGAGLFESFHREYNYPDKSHIRSLKDASTYGAYTFFCSDSCAAYSNRALDEIGGFQSVLLGEDTLAASQLLHRGHKIAYVADAVVRHSHCYTLAQEFKRHFDTGLARQAMASWLAPGGSDLARGKAYVHTLLRRVWQEKPTQLPYALLHCMVKFIGYQTGLQGQFLPLPLKKRLSSQDFFWKI